jgi:hypothetical protein
MGHGAMVKLRMVAAKCGNPEGLSEVTVEKIDSFLAALPALLERHGVRVGARGSPWRLQTHR